MFKPFFTVFVVVVLSLFAPAAGQKRESYGPVVSAFLSGLDEEMTELEFMVRHREISRDDYEQTKQRLAVRRRFIERTALRSREDRVPELQVLAEDELSTLIPVGELHPDKLQVGMQVSGRWKLVAIERIRNRFFVLEKLPQMELVRVVPERKLGSEIDPRDVIETIIVREEPGEKSQAAEQSTAETAFPPPRPAASSAESAPSVKSEPRRRDPRLLHIYLPEYTDKAREKRIEGELVVRALLQRDGKIKNIKVEKGLGYGLDDRAVTAVKRLGFLPAEQNGREVDALTQIVFDFRVEKVTVHLAGLGVAESAKGAK
ncbi:MAG: energy transducer TonB [Acidobacteriota bacterium]|nr:energy transducer TonB [Acidobacteriota bacterium]